jgi:hypothetical protein
MSRLHRDWPRRTALRIVLLALLAAPGPLSAAPPDPEGAGSAEKAPKPQVGLEQLLKLPESLDYQVERRGGNTRVEWQERFQKAHADIEAAEKALQISQAKLEEVAAESGGWKLAPPGAPANASDSPLDYQLRQDLRRQRAELAHAEQQLQDLGIEANLAGVPEEWRK